jgi:hypothetical protein
MEPPAVMEKQVTLSVLQRFDNDASIDNTAALLRRLYETIERSGASFISGQLRVIVNEKYANDLVQAAKDAGITATVQDQ